MYVYTVYTVYSVHTVYRLMATRVITIASSHMTSEAPTKWWGPLGNLVNLTRQSAVRTVINIYIYICV